LLGTLVGAWISCRMTYSFQKRLLEQQLAFQKALLDQQLSEDKKTHDEYLEYLRKVNFGDATAGDSLRKQLFICSNLIKDAIESLKK